VHIVRKQEKLGTARLWIALLAAFATVIALVPQGAGAEELPAESLAAVIVREAPGAGDGPEHLVERLGGTVGQSLDLIDGFAATVPTDAVGALAASPEIAQVTQNAVLELSKAGWESASTLSSADPKTSSSSLYEVARYMGADEMWDAGYTGDGVDVALIDSGVVPVNGLTARGKVFNGPDLSFESQYDGLRYLDTFGHGTHMAGIIAGRDDKATKSLSKVANEYFVGIAPGARIVSIKVADAQGVTDVSQVIAAIDWVVQHRRDGDLDIRVLNLSFGTNSDQPYVLDPLAYAVEQAWNAGVVVVVAAGNDGNARALRNPALDPFVIAVGAVDSVRTKNQDDDVVASFSNCGTSSRSVDVVAHGRSITSLRAPGSYADLENPGSVVADRLFVGSGTSQAAAVVSGAVALLLDENPNLSPDQVKSILMSEAAPIEASSALCQGAGAVDVRASADSAVPPASKVSQDYSPSNGGGSLDASRGSDRITADGVALEGEQDIMGNQWIGFNEIVTSCVKEQRDTTTSLLSTLEPVKIDPVTLEPVKIDPVTLEPVLTPEIDAAETTKVCSDQLQPTKTLWNGGDWNGATWSGASWSGASWSGATWSGASWSGASWSGATWSGASWSGASWSGATWSGASWSGLGWLGLSWY
jgi:serine protease AprX